MACLKCGYTSGYISPSYNSYLTEKYSHTYTRDIKSDPQMRHIMNVLDIKEGERVIDVGCGVGDYTNEIFKKTTNCTGIDLNIDSALQKYQAVPFLQHDLNTRFPINDCSADVVVSINVIEHLIDHVAFLSECKRVLKKDGKLVITTANLEFILHNYFFDATHLHEWTLEQFANLVGTYFEIDEAKKSSSMFNYYPFNKITTMFLKPDLLIIAHK